MTVYCYIILWLVAMVVSNASNVCIYTEYSPASRVYPYYDSWMPETIYLRVYARVYEISAIYSIKLGYPVAVLFVSSHRRCAV